MFLVPWKHFRSIFEVFYEYFWSIRKYSTCWWRPSILLIKYSTAMYESTEDNTRIMFGLMSSRCACNRWVRFWFWWATSWTSAWWYRDIQSDSFERPWMAGMYGHVGPPILSHWVRTRFLHLDFMVGSEVRIHWSGPTSANMCLAIPRFTH